MLTTKNWRTWTTPIALCLVSLVWTGCTPAGPRALLEGERLLKSGKYPEAIARLQVATQLLPAKAQAWNHLGLAYHHAGQPSQAFKAYEQARRCDPNLTPVHFNLGCLLLEQNNPEAATSELTSYTVLERESIPGWLKLGTAQMRSRQWDAAERSFQTALHLQTDLPEAWNSLGVIAAQRKRSRDALNSFNAALQYQPQYGPALLNLAILNHHYLNNRSVALRQYREYLTLASSERNASAVQENIDRLQGELAPAPVQREPTNLVVVPPVQVPPVVSNALPALRPATNAFASRLSTNMPSSTLTNRARTLPGHLAVADTNPAPTGNKPIPDFSRRAEPLARTTVVAQASSPVLSESVWTDVRRSVPPAAESTNRPPSPNLGTETPPPPPAKTEVVQLTDEPAPRLAQDTPSLRPPSDSTVTSGSAATATQLDQASALLNSKIRDEAVPTVEEKPRVIDRFNPTTWFKGKKRPPPTTSSELSSETPASSSSDLARPTESAAAVKPLPSRKFAYHSTGKPVPGDRSKAAPSFQQGIQLQKSGRLREAIDAYRNAVKLDPSFFEAQYNLGLAAYELKEIPLSLSAYETALSINPTSANARYNFSLALQHGGYFEDAARELEKVLDDRPEEVRAHLSVANLYAERLGKPSLARKHYRKVLELDPQNAEASAIRYWLAANP